MKQEQKLFITLAFIVIIFTLGCAKKMADLADDAVAEEIVLNESFSQKQNGEKTVESQSFVPQNDERKLILSGRIQIEVSSLDVM